MDGVENPEDLLFLSPDHHSHHQIAKGKRTRRRQRPPSPHHGAVSMTSSSSATGGGGDVCSSALSPSSSGENAVYSSTEEEEEDMANCLILLAQGDAFRPTMRSDACDDDGDGGSKIGVFGSKKFSEVISASATTAAATRAGFYVYECKTCSRVFPSFQALGGHRASHKKPKTAPPMVDPEQKNNTKPVVVVMGLDANDDEEEGQFSKTAHPLSVLRAVDAYKGHHPVGKPKIHECNICGSEFTSGQALGGHMRRHRSAAPVVAPSATVSGTTIISTSDSMISGDKSSQSILALDLNLPAPAEEDNHHRHHSSIGNNDSNKFQFTARQQPIVFSAPALVDCHY